MELTIGIPVYKNVDTLNTALKSIATQKNKEVDCKVIISEDFSTDEIHQQIVQLLEKWTNLEIEYHFNLPALGMSGNWNHCIQLASTGYVALLHDDDFLYSNYLDEVAKVMKSKLRFDVLFWDNDEWADGKKVRRDYHGIKRVYDNLKKGKIKKYKSGDYFFGGLEGKTLPTCGTLYKRDGFEEYEQKYGYSVDEIYAEKKYKDPFSYTPTHTLVLYTNHLPKVGAIDKGTETNLSSTYKVKRSFVLEREEHRQSMSNQSWIFRFCNKYLHDGMKLDSMYPWQDCLFPEYMVTKKILNEKKMFNIIKRIYIYSQVFSYKNMKIKNRKKCK